MRVGYLLLTVAFLGSPALSQKEVHGPQELRAEVREAGDDVEKLLKIASYAHHHEMEKLAKMIAKKVLALEPDNGMANELLGRVHFKGTWMDRGQAEELYRADRKKIAADLRAKYEGTGLVEIEALWVDKDHLADAKKGVFHHDGEVVNAFEKEQLLRDRVRHPATGQFIEATHRADAEQGLFPLSYGNWGNLEQANEYHSSRRHPWTVRTRYGNVRSTLELATIKQQLAPEVDAALGRLIPVFGGNQPAPYRRPTVVVVGTKEAFREQGARSGGPGSAHGAFLSNDHYIAKVAGSRVRVGTALWHKDWGPYYVRHAAGLALSHAYCGDETDEVPVWFHRALGGYVERHMRPSDAQYFGRQYVTKGGVKKLARWLSHYEISPELPSHGYGDIGYNVYGAGLVLSFCMAGGDKVATDALMKVTDAFARGKKVAKTIQRLEKVIASRERQLTAYLAKTTSE